MFAFVVRQFARRSSLGVAWVLAVELVLSSGSARHAAGQSLKLRAVIEPAPSSAFASGAMLTTCSAMTPPQSLNELVRFSEYIPPAGSTVPGIAEPFLLAGPYACIPNAERLFTRSISELDAVDEAKFLEITGLDFERNFMAPANELADGRQRFSLKFADLNQHLGAGDFDRALGILDESLTWSRGRNSIYLARFLLSSADFELQSRGLALLDHLTDGRLDPQAELEFGRVALKQRRWVDARSHLEQALALLQFRDELAPALRLALEKEACFGMIAANEQLLCYADALKYIHEVLDLDPHDPSALLHKGAIRFIQNPNDEARRAECLKLFAEVHQASPTIGEDDARLHVVPPAELLLIELQSMFNRMDDVVARWNSLLAEPDKRPAEALRIYLTAARWFCEQGKLAEAERCLTQADLVDADSTARSDIRLLMHFYLGDPEALAALSMAYVDDPANERIGRMLALTLLDSPNEAERRRGERIARHLLKNHPDSKSLKVVVAYAAFILGREQEALRKIRPVLPTLMSDRWYSHGPTPVLNSNRESRGAIDDLLRVFSEARNRSQGIGFEPQVINGQPAKQYQFELGLSIPFDVGVGDTIAGNVSLGYVSPTGTELAAETDDGRPFEGDDFYLMARIVSAFEKESRLGAYRAREYLRPVGPSARRYRKQTATLLAALEETLRQK